MATQTYGASEPIVRRCAAHSARTGQPCRRTPIVGGHVCSTHGGRAPQVKRKAAQRVADMLAEAIDPNRVLRETARLAYSDIRQVLDESGRVLPVQQWPEDVARAVKSIEIVRGNVDKGDGKYDDVVRITLWDKGQRLENLMKMHNQLVEKVEVKHTHDIVGRLQAGRKRVAERLLPQAVVVDAELTGNNTPSARPEQASSRRDSDL